MSTHILKTHPGPFQDSWLGLKSYEVRLDDRDYELGDRIDLVEWHPHIGATGREIKCLRVIHKLTGGQYGVEKGYCVLGLDFASVQRTGVGEE